MSLLLSSHDVDVAEGSSPLGFETAGGGSWPKWHRYLTLDGKRAYELGNICSTCTFFFQRMEGANKKVEIGDLVDRLANGLAADDLATTQKLSAMIPTGHYHVHFTEFTPVAVTLGTHNDYFVNEQQTVWGLDGFWGLPYHPRVPYYRTGDRAISSTQRLFEFVIPMYPRNSLKAERVAQYRAMLDEGRRPTAVSLSILDVKGAAMADTEEFEHWCLAHYVLDGHHKIEAAALAGKPITLVSFVTRDNGVSTPDQVAKLGTLLDFR
jgi:hypothetical protein